MFIIFISFFLFINLIISFIRGQGIFLIRSDLRGILIKTHLFIVSIGISLLAYHQIKDLIVESEGNPYLRIFTAFVIALVISWFINFQVKEEGKTSWKRIFLTVGVIVGGFLLWFAYLVLSFM